MLILLILPVIFICLADSVELVRKKQWRELITMGLLIGTAFFYVLAENFNIPTPVDGLQRLLRPAGELLFRPRY